MKNKKYISLAVLGSLALVAPIFAQASTTTPPAPALHGGMGMGRGGFMGVRMGMGVVGTVASINGTTITVTSVNRMGMGRGGQDGQTPNTTPSATPAPVTYTIDASSATVMKAGVASTVSAITVGDTVMVQGTVTGTNVVAKTIRDGIPAKVQKPTPTPVIIGNGQPIIAGTISAINGSALTITNKSNVTYTVDASQAKVESKGVLSTLSTVAIGDNVVIQGTVNGTSVTAYSVTDQGITPTTQTTGTPQARGNMFSGIGQFFKHLFGF